MDLGPLLGLSPLFSRNGSILGHSPIHKYENGEEERNLSCKCTVLCYILENIYIVQISKRHISPAFALNMQIPRSGWSCLHVKGKQNLCVSLLSVQQRYILNPKRNVSKWFTVLLYKMRLHGRFASCKSCTLCLRTNAKFELGLFKRDFCRLIWTVCRICTISLLLGCIKVKNQYSRQTTKNHQTIGKVTTRFRIAAFTDLEQWHFVQNLSENLYIYTS